MDGNTDRTCSINQSIATPTKFLFFSLSCACRIPRSELSSLLDLESMTTVIYTSLGPVQGFVDTHVLSDKSTAALPSSSEKPVQKYLGVPFGQAERWSQACSPKPWSEIRQCTEYGAACPQLPGVLSPKLAAATPGFYTRTHVGISEEDMFTVNVYSSEGVKEGDDVSVMVWIYGGSWRDGAASAITYDPTNLVRSATKPLIVVSCNYRVNCFGFFASKDLIDRDGLVGNYGIRDQLLALRWVKQNIGKFGGDSTDVTIFGESAGAASVGYHVGGLEPLFKRAIMQSGGGSTMGYTSVQEHERQWELLLKHFKIDKEDPERVSKARALSTRQILGFQAAFPTLGWSACIESGPKAIWSCHPDARIARGEYPASLESVMLGCCKDEGTIFAELADLLSSQPPVTKFLSLFGEATQHIHTVYEGIQDVASHKTGMIDHPSSKLFHDAIFEAPVRFLAETFIKTPNVKTGKTPSVYLYHSEAILPAWEELGWGVHHFAEVPFVFNSSSFWNNDSNSPAAKTAANFGRKWTSFAFSGTPSSDWPKYSSDERSRYVFKNSGASRLEDVSDGSSEAGIMLFQEVIKARWGIKDKTAQL